MLPTWKRIIIRATILIQPVKYCDLFLLYCLTLFHSVNDPITLYYICIAHLWPWCISLLKEGIFVCLPVTNYHPVYFTFGMWIAGDLRNSRFEFGAIWTCYTININKLNNKQSIRESLCSAAARRDLWALRLHVMILSTGGDQSYTSLPWERWGEDISLCLTALKVRLCCRLPDSL